jgi:hypothetical protein
MPNGSQYDALADLISLACQTFEFDLFTQFPTKYGDLGVVPLIHQGREHGTSGGAVAIVN